MTRKTVEFKATATVRGQRSTLVRVAMVPDGIAIEQFDADYVSCLRTIRTVEEARATDESSEVERWRGYED